jgi:hypothetical protein
MAIGEAASQQTQHLNLAFAVTSRTQHGVDRVTIQPTGLYFLGYRTSGNACRGSRPM